jgi:heme-degrading monooxygenase HmoA
MITRIVKMTFQPEKVYEFLSLFYKKKMYIEQFDGCRNVVLLNDIQNKNVFFTYSHWENEDSLNNYRNSELFNDVWKKTKILFAAKPEAWSLEEK